LEDISTDVREQIKRKCSKNYSALQRRVQNKLILEKWVYICL
jgi:hypothetical protein